MYLMYASLCSRVEQRLLPDLGSGARGGAAAAILPRSLGHERDPVRHQPLTLSLLSLLFLIKLICPLSIRLIKKVISWRKLPSTPKAYLFVCVRHLSPSLGHKMADLHPS